MEKIFIEKEPKEKDDAQLLKKQINIEKRCCGNCRYHNMYDYPDQIFCFAKFQRREKPVVSILDCCDQWESKLQECFCLEDTLKKLEKNQTGKVTIRNIQKMKRERLG